MDYLSNIELYYTVPANCVADEISIEGDEYKHIIKVMRHSINDEIYVTNGMGKIFLCEIKKIFSNTLELTSIKQFNYKNKLSNIVFCLPKLRNPERFEFALEKSIELGITNFIIYQASRSVAKAEKIERWNKIALSAMKQSLQSYLPQITIKKSIYDINSLEGEKIIFEQNSKIKFEPSKFNKDKKYFFIFGPEGGLSEEELNLFDQNNFYKLAENRLRTETAVIKCASILSG